MKLSEYLSYFKGAETEELLREEFGKLARHFLYGGFIKVGEDYEIYPYTVEFYFHSEEGSPYKIYDPIVYHRNNRKDSFLKTVPYFPIMTLHAHVSGFDITFENEVLKYRASALIRAYSIYDASAKQFLRTRNGKCVDNRSTFLYDYLNGFPLDESNHIKWVDKEWSTTQTIKSQKRKNVFLYDENEQKTKTPDERQWSFTREEEVIR
ncbi:MAG: hypothetical protein Q4D56_08385 [Bacteroides sp.]|nr:hypothetical protein [Bacteroides sp.]